jgi:Putative Flp pilus-assembly TadE/G-like
MVLVAIAMVAIIAMAALSIDVITLYLAREEAQRSADTGALAAARVISISGMTGDPTNSSSSWQAICGGSGSPATQAATGVATQSAVGGAVATTVNVTYSAGGEGPTGNCNSLPPAFAVNPMVTVQVTRASLPTFFSRIWGNTGNTVSATATAEAFNPSNSGNVGNQTTGTITPVQPRCVKPWVVPNIDPLNPAPVTVGHGFGATTYYCGQGGPEGTCKAIVSTVNGSIQNPGISTGGNSNAIGETFWLSPDCRHTGSSCTLRQSPPGANYSEAGYVQGPPNLQFVPGLAPTTTPAAVPTVCAGGGVSDLYQQAIAGCDQTTVYQCGLQSSTPNEVNLGENPDLDTANAVQCLINEADPNTLNDGQDAINISQYPFQILEGSANPLALGGLGQSSVISVSSSIVSLPIYDSAATTITQTPATRPVSIVGFLQVFINQVDQYGNVSVTVLNVAGCGNGATQTPNAAVTGSSPVPIRLITPP